MFIWSSIIITLLMAAVLTLIFDVLGSKHRKQPEQATACFCPKCRNELISSGSFVSDKELVTYKCVICEEVSMWYFDAPVPLLIKE